MNNLRPIAQAVRSQGRGKDTQLVHMTPNEVQGLQALAKAHGGSLSVNPNTGLPEAGFLDSLLPTILGAGLAAATGGPSLMIGAGLGALQFARTGSLEKGLMAGLGAYGGAGLASGLMGVGAGAASSGSTNTLNDAVQANEAARKALANTSLDAAGRVGANQTAKAALENLALQQQQVAAANTFGGNLSNMGKGLEIAFKNPSAFMHGYGETGLDLARYAGASVAGPMMEPPEQKKREVDNVRFEYDYSPNRVSEEDLAAQRRENPYGELTYFRPSYGDRRDVTVGAAQGGIMRLADGGSTTTSKFSYDPATQTYKRLDEEILETDKPVGAVESLGVSDRSSSGNGGAPEDSGKNYWADYETKNGREATLQAQVEAREGILGKLAEAFAPGVMAAKAIQSWINPPAKDYSVPWSEMTPAEKAYAANNQAPVTEADIAAARAQDSASRSSGDTISHAGVTATRGDYAALADAFNEGSDSAKGGLIGLARGGALRFAEGDVVPGSRIYPEPVVTLAPQLVPAQPSQELAAAALQQQQLDNQASQFMPPSAITPTQTTYKAPEGIASGYATDYTRATPESFQAGLAALRPARKDLPGGFSGYGDESLVRQPALVPNVDGTLPVAPVKPSAKVAPGGRTDTTLTQFTPDQIVDEAKARSPAGIDFKDTLLTYGKGAGYTYEQIDEILGLPAGSAAAFNSRTALTKLPVETITAAAQKQTPESGDFRNTLLDYGQDAGYTNDQMDIILGLPSGSTAAYDSRSQITQYSVPEIVQAAEEKTSAGADVRDTLLDYGQTSGLTNEQMDIALGLPAGSAAAYAGSVGKKSGGILGLAAGGMSKGGFVIPADVVSALGNGSTDAGLRKLKAKIGSVQAIKGKGDGLSDSIPTNIDGKQPARVADGEAYVDPRTVAKIGGGNPKKGAQKLYAMMDRVRQQAHGKTSQQRKVDHKAVV